MFSPDPARTNAFVTAHIKFMDGSTDTYTIPRNNDLNFSDRYQYGERFRVLTEVLRSEDGRFMRRDVAKFVLRQVREKNFHKIPLKVELFENWNTTPDVNQKFLPQYSQNKVYLSRKFYTHEVL
jgi:hypothetical protein